MANIDLVFDITKAPSLQPKQQAIYGRVGDGGLKAATIKLLSNGSDYNITGLNPIFEGLKADGTHIIDNSGGTVLDPQGGVFRYVFPSEAFTAKGDYVQAFFKLMRDDQVDSTVELDIHVAPNLVEMGINSKHFLTDYDSLKSQLEEKADNFVKELSNKNDDWLASIKTALDKVDTLEAKQQTLETKLNSSDVVTHSEMTTILGPLEKVTMVNLDSEKLYNDTSIGGGV